MIEHPDVKEFIEHFGTKGMKWGVRKARRADKSWQKNIYSVRGAIDVHNAVADRMNGGALDALNKKHPKAHLDHPDTPATKKYLREYESMATRFTKEAVGQVHGISPSGNLRARLDVSNPNEARIVVETINAQHADDVLPKLIFDLEIENGHIVRMSNVLDDLKQSTLNTLDFIEHFGTKGMRWGVRKNRGGVTTARNTERTSFSKSPKKLTTAELEKRIKRMETEKRYNELNKRDVTAGAKLAHEIVTNVGRTVVTTVATGAALFAIRTAVNRKMGIKPDSKLPALDVGALITKRGK